MTEVFFAASQNTNDGILVGAKLIGAVLLSVIILFVLLKLIRIAANLINRALYKRYLSKLDIDAPKMTFEEYIMSINGVKVFDKPTITEKNKSKDAAVSDNDIKKFGKPTVTEENESKDVAVLDSDIKKFGKPTVTEENESKDVAVSDSNTQDMTFNLPSAAEDHEVSGTKTSSTHIKNTDNDSDNLD